VSAASPTQVNAARFSSRDWIAASTFALAAAAFRIPYLTSKSFWMDEGFSAFMARADFHTALTFVKGGELNMVLYYALLRLWAQISITEFWFRLLSALFSIAAVAVIYLLGARMFGRRTGMLAAALIAVHPADVAFAQEVRSYSLAVMLVSVSFLFLSRIAERGRTRAVVGYVLAAALAAYAHFIALFVIVTQWLWLLAGARREHRWRSLLATSAALVAVLLPLVAFTAAAGHQLVGWVARPTMHDALEVFTLITLPGWRAGVYVALWSLAGWAIFRTGSAQTRSHVAMVTSWLFVPVALALAVSAAKPILVARFFVVCVPAAVLLAAFGLNSLSTKLMPAIAIAVVLVSFNATLSYYRHPQLKEDWRGATQYVIAHGAANDDVIVEPAYCGFTVNYYRDLDRRLTKPRATDVSGAEMRPTADSIWLLVRGASANNAVAGDALARFRRSSATGYCEVASLQFNLIRVWHFSKC
jgi:mannosyltransferase